MGRIMNRIEEIEKRLNNATSGDWIYSKHRDTHDSCIHTKDAVEEYGYIGEKGGVVGSSEWIWISDEDGNFIANSKSDIQFLLDEIKRLKGS